VSSPLDLIILEPSHGRLSRTKSSFLLYQCVKALLFVSSNNLRLDLSRL